MEAICDLLPDYSGCEIIAFRSGSIIVDVNLLFDSQSNVTNETIFEKLESKVESNNGSLFDGSSVFVIDAYTVSRK